MHCCQALLFFKGEELQIRSMVFDGYLAWITSVLVRTLGILVVQKEKQNIDMLPPDSIVFIFGPCQIRFYSFVLCYENGCHY